MLARRGLAGLTHYPGLAWAWPGLAWLGAAGKRLRGEGSGAGPQALRAGVALVAGRRRVRCLVAAARQAAGVLCCRFALLPAGCSRRSRARLAGPAVLKGSDWFRGVGDVMGEYRADMSCGR